MDAMGFDPCHMLLNKTDKEKVPSISIFYYLFYKLLMLWIGFEEIKCNGIWFSSQWPFS